jgi:hypothetical protein
MVPSSRSAQRNSVGLQTYTHRDDGSLASLDWRDKKPIAGMLKELQGWDPKGKTVAVVEWICTSVCIGAEPGAYGPVEQICTEE